MHRLRRRRGVVKKRQIPANNLPRFLISNQNPKISSALISLKKSLAV